MPFFSVVIATYNRLDRLQATMDSVLRQSFTDFELLVMDDGSSDGTMEWIESVNDRRVVYSWAENSGGPATPRNRGLDQASAEWICFLDADDIWYANKLEETHRAILAEPPVDAICHNENMIHADGGLVRKLVHGPSEKDLYRAMLLSGNRCSTSAMTVRKSFLDDHGLRFNESPDYVIVEDYDLWLRMANAEARFMFMDQYFGEYIIEDDNISLNTERFLQNQEALLRDHVYGVQDFESDREKLWRRIRVRLDMAKVRRFATKGDYGTAIKGMVKAAARSPGGVAMHSLSKIVERTGRVI